MAQAAASGEAAVAVLGDEEVDVLLVDADLPGEGLPHPKPRG